MANADLALAEVLKLFEPKPPKCAFGIHSTAVVDPTATISEGVAGGAGLAGSVTLGDGVIMGGRSGVKDHVTVGSGTTLGGNTGVVSDVAPGKTLLGFPADEYRKPLKVWAAKKQLPDLIKKLKKRWTCNSGRQSRVSFG